MKTPNSYISSLSVGRGIGASLVVLATLSSAAACSSDSEGPEVASTDAHFSVACPSGGLPTIAEVRHSGAMPADDTGKRFASAIIRLSCPGEYQAPAITQDSERNGACLGYGKESHLVVSATQTREQMTEFFVTNSLVGVVGADDAIISKVNVHYHGLDSSADQTAYRQNNCSSY